MLKRSQTTLRNPGEKRSEVSGQRSEPAAAGVADPVGSGKIFLFRFLLIFFTVRTWIRNHPSQTFIIRWLITRFEHDPEHYRFNTYDCRIGGSHCWARRLCSPSIHFLS